jgi:hypothetical protein
MKPQRTLNDPNARAAAIHTFKHLKHHGYAFEPDLAHSWAIVHRWKPNDAQQLSEYAAGVSAAIDATRARIRLEGRRSTDGDRKQNPPKCDCPKGTGRGQCYSGD